MKLQSFLQSIPLQFYRYSFRQTSKADIIWGDKNNGGFMNSLQTLGKLLDIFFLAEHIFISFKLLFQ
jgi:hypothetical protein